MSINDKIQGSSLSVKNKPRLFYGYVIVGCSFLILMCMWGSQYCFGVFFKPMLKEFGLSRAALSGAYSINLIVQAIAAIFAGRISDKYGPRLVVTVCGSCLGISYLVMSQVQLVWQIYVAFGILASIGIAGSWVPLVSTIARWFVARRGMMSGVVSAGIGVGIMIFPPLAGYLIANIGWRPSYIIVGLIVLVVVIINAQFLKRDPSHLGLSALGMTAQDADSTAGYTFSEALRTRQFWLVSTVYLMLALCLQTIFVHIVPHATDIGMSDVKAATIISVIGAVSIISKVTVGTAADRLGNKQIMIIVASLMLLAMIVVRFAEAPWMLYVFAVIFAFGYGGFSAVQLPYMAELFGLKSLGVIFGFSYFVQMVTGACGPFAAGRIFDAAANYRPAFMILAILGLLAVLLAISVKATPYAAERKL